MRLGTAGEVVILSVPKPVGPVAAALAGKTPGTTVDEPAATRTLLKHEGGSKPATGPKQTWCMPAARSVHMPQSSRGIPSTLMVDATAGLVITRSEPS